MAIGISIDTEALTKRLDIMLGKIDHFKRVDVGAGLSAFQVEDMNRHRPFTMRYRARGLAVTKIRPHSLYEMQHSARATRRVIRYLRINPKTGLPRKHRRHRPPRFYYHYSNRPILREELYSVLNERMNRLLEEKIKW
jgi:hypothetical protein